MNEIIKNFVSSSFGKIRVVIRDKKVWFIAKDVADILEYSQTQAMLKRLKDPEISKIKSSKMDDALKPNGNNDLVIVNQAGLYRSIFGSKKPEAEKFQNWVFEEVLPAIHKHGFYVDEGRISTDRVAREKLISYIQQLRYEDVASTSILKELFTHCVDYNSKSGIARKFFATVQNKLHYAATGKVATEIVYDRCDYRKNNIGMVALPRNKSLTVTNGCVAKNYLEETEFNIERAISVIYVEKIRQLVTDHKGNLKMMDCIESLDKTTDFLDKQILKENYRSPIKRARIKVKVKNELVMFKEKDQLMLF